MITYQDFYAAWDDAVHHHVNERILMRPVSPLIDKVMNPSLFRHSPSLKPPGNDDL
jgi:hypothetical protein